MTIKSTLKTHAGLDEHSAYIKLWMCVDRCKL